MSFKRASDFASAPSPKRFAPQPSMPTLGPWTRKPTRPLPPPTPIPFATPSFPTCNEAFIRDFFLTKNNNKSLRMGVDLISLSPFVSLTSQAVGQSYSFAMRMSQDNLIDLLKDNVYEYIHKALTARTDVSLKLKDLSLTVESTPAYAFVVITHETSTVKVQLGESSWQKLKDCELIIKDKLTECQKISLELNQHMPNIMSNCLQYCNDHKVDVEKLTFHSGPTVAKKALTSFPSPISQPIMNELICNHARFMYLEINKAQQQ